MRLAVGALDGSHWRAALASEASVQERMTAETLRLWRTWRGLAWGEKV